MESWSNYATDPASNRQSRYNALPPNSDPSPQHPREYASQQVPQPQGHTQQGYQAYHGQAGTATAAGSTNPRPENPNEYMDIQMQDADSYGRGKFQQQQQPRQPFLNDELTSPQQTQRYSPMPQQGQYTTSASSQSTNLPPIYPHSQHRQSPSRPNYTNASQSYYNQNASSSSPRTGALPPIQNYQQHSMQHSGPLPDTSPPILTARRNLDPDAGQDSSGGGSGGGGGGGRYFPQSAATASQTALMFETSPPQPSPPRDPAPRLQRVTNMSDLQPRINTQPAHRRANPEGGFISVRTRPLFPEVTLLKDRWIARTSPYHISSRYIPHL